MAGLDPAIHVFALRMNDDVNARDEPAHDGVAGRCCGSFRPPDNAPIEIRHGWVNQMRWAPGRIFD
jgi:hypothetical protein